MAPSYFVLVVPLAVGAVVAAAFVLLRIRRRIHALRLEVTRIATLCGVLQAKIDGLTGRTARGDEALFFERYPEEVLPLIDQLDRAGRLTEGTAERLRRLTTEILAEAWSDGVTGVAGSSVPRPTSA